MAREKENATHLPINWMTIPFIPQALEQRPFDPLRDIPSELEIYNQVFFTPGKEIRDAKQNPHYIGLGEQELKSQVTTLIHQVRTEMISQEQAARLPPAAKLQALRQLAQSGGKIDVLVLSGPGSYYRLTKNDRYENDPSMFGADRVRNDYATILGIAIAGIQQGWPDTKLLPILRRTILTSDDTVLNLMKADIRAALDNSGVQFVYSGLKEEIDPLKLLLDRDAFVPADRVSFVGPDNIQNTVTQAQEISKFMKNRRSDVTLLTTHGAHMPRSLCIFDKYNVVPHGSRLITAPIGSSVEEGGAAYRAGEIRGTIFYYLTDRASFNPAPHRILAS